MLSERSRSDARIQHEVLRALERDENVVATDIGVTVHHGVVTLTGTVRDYGEKVAAAEVAHRACRIHTVADDIQVKAPGTAGRTDTELAEIVCQMLEEDALVPHGCIDTTVSNGWVRLEGSVPHARVLHEAERVVWQVPGVHGVTNCMTVVSAPRACTPIPGAPGAEIAEQDRCLSDQIVVPAD